MSKTIKLSDAVRVIVEDILEQRKALGLERRWKQAEHSAAISKAALAFAQDFADLNPDGRGKVSWKSFAEQYGEHGFAGGNLSQFQQALDALPETDTCHVVRPKRDGTALPDYE